MISFFHVWITVICINILSDLVASFNVLEIFKLHLREHVDEVILDVEVLITYQSNDIDLGFVDQVVFGAKVEL